MATRTQQQAPAVKQTARELARSKKQAASDFVLAVNVDFENTKVDESGKWFYRLELENDKTAIVYDDYFDTAIENGQLRETEDGEIEVNYKHASRWFDPEGFFMITRKGSGGFSYSKK
jgi:hypothetical protein